MRTALASADARLLEAVLADGDGYAGPHAKCPDGHQAGYAGVRDKTITTVPGPVTLQRAWYHCAACKHGFAPRDAQLKVAGASESPGVAEMIALAGSKASFARAGGLIAALAGITVSPRTIERSAEASGAAARAAAAAQAAAIRERRIVPLPPAEPVPDMHYVEVDGTGVPVRPSQTQGRTGKSEDGKAGTREVKLARFFTVSRLDQDGRPVMDPGSSTYVFSFDGKNALAELVEAEYLRRGGEHCRQVVALGDGAAWIWTMAEDLYPHATHIVDIYHAREHLTDLANHLAFITPDPQQWLASRSEELDAGNIQAIIDAASCYPLGRRQSRGTGQEARLLQAQRPPDALSAPPRPGHVHRLGRHRRRHQGHRGPACQAGRHALDHPGRSRHHRPAHPARQRPLGRTLASTHRPAGQATRCHLTDTATQTPGSAARARSSPTKLTCTRPHLTAARL